MQHQIVKELNAVGGWEVFEFNKQTEPTKRHRSSRSSRTASEGRAAKLCVATYPPPPSASRSPPPTASSSWSRARSGDRLQAGRIHRLGQTKEVLIKRFAFRNTIEHAIVDLHEEIERSRRRCRYHRPGRAADVQEAQPAQGGAHVRRHRRSPQVRAAWRVQQASRPTTSTWWNSTSLAAAAASGGTSPRRRTSVCGEVAGPLRRDDPNMPFMAGSAA